MTTTTTPTQQAHGPVDFLLMEFERDRLTGSAARALMDLVEAGTIRLFDLLVVSKGEDDAIEVLELTDPTSAAGGFSYFAGARSGLLGEDDVSEAASAMRAGTVAALIVYENTWAVPFVTAARANGGEVIASARIPAVDLMAALDALEQTD